MLALRLKKLRTERGQSQAELAERAGLSQPAIGVIEAGQKSPTVRTLEKLAAALEVPVTDLPDDRG